MNTPTNLSYICSPLFLLYTLLLSITSAHAQTFSGSGFSNGTSGSDASTSDVLGAGFGSFPAHNQSFASLWDSAFTNPNTTGFQAFPGLNLSYSSNSTTDGGTWFLRTAIAQITPQDTPGGLLTDQSVWLDLPKGIDLQSPFLKQNICSIAIDAPGLKVNRQKVSNSQTSRENGGCDDVWGSACSDALRQALIESSQLGNQLFSMDVCKGISLPVLQVMPPTCQAVLGNSIAMSTVAIGGPNGKTTSFSQQNATTGSFWNRYNNQADPASNSTAFLDQIMDTVFPVFIFTVPNSSNTSTASQQESQVQVAMACPILDEIGQKSGSSGNNSTRSGSSTGGKTSTATALRPHAQAIVISFIMFILLSDTLPNIRTIVSLLVYVGDA